MGKHLSRLKVAGLTLALCGLTASAAKLTRATGYLTVVGPTPLRFEPAASPPAPLPTPLQPLAQVIQGEAPAAPASTNAPAPSTAAAARPAPRPELKLDLPPITSHNNAAAEATLNPQAILGYLVPLPTNAPAPPLQVPAFVPPILPEPPSSKATYESR